MTDSLMIALGASLATLAYTYLLYRHKGESKE